jgi:hypothetical protein
MDAPEQRNVTWEQVLFAALNVEEPARLGHVDPADGATLALLILDFHAGLQFPVRRRSSLFPDDR